jgi:hypothetical protein
MPLGWSGQSCWRIATYWGDTTSMILSSDTSKIFFSKKVIRDAGL